MFVIHRCVRCEQTFINVSKSCDCSSPNVLVSRIMFIVLKLRKRVNKCINFLLCFFFFQTGGLCFSASESLPPKGVATVRFAQLVSVFIQKHFQAISLFTFSKSFKFCSWKTKGCGLLSDHSDWKVVFIKIECRHVDQANVVLSNMFKKMYALLETEKEK